jgi:hypothetical protein
LEVVDPIIIRFVHHVAEKNVPPIWAQAIIRRSEKCSSIAQVKQYIEHIKSRHIEKIFIKYIFPEKPPKHSHIS